MAYNPTRALSSLGQDDYEEQQLVLRFNAIMAKADRILRVPPSQRPKGVDSLGLTKDEQIERQSLIAKLGYDPVAGRKGRPRGPASRESMPSPMPEVGTKLRSCMGDTYEVAGYAYHPKMLGGSGYILYRFDGELYARSATNLFAGQLATGEPIVTWPEDPRGLKPAVKVPPKFARQATKQALAEERRQMDADYQQDQESRRSGRRY